MSGVSFHVGLSFEDEINFSTSAFVKPASSSE